MINDISSKPRGVPKLWDGYGFPFVFIPGVVLVCLILLLVASHIS